MHSTIHTQKNTKNRPRNKWRIYLHMAEPTWQGMQQHQLPAFVHQLGRDKIAMPIWCWDWTGPADK
jgi:hypothetical protein